MKHLIATSDTILQAAKALQAGSLVAFPTETVYGLGADATNSEAVAKIFETKGRPHFNPLIIHTAHLDQAQALAQFNSTALFLAQQFWPGPLTLVLPKQPKCPVSELATAGLETIALRIPRHPVAFDMLTKAGCPIAAPSANLSGHVSPTLAAHVIEDFADKDIIVLDDGATTYGLESTIISCLEEAPVLLRPGSLSQEDIAQALGQEIIGNGNTESAEEENNASPNAPGQLKSHYAPKATLRLNAVSIHPNEGLIAFGPHRLLPNAAEFNLSKSADVREAAANLFQGLRYLDSLDVKHIAVMPVPDIGLGRAINDRLMRAAADKDTPKP